MLNTNTIYTKPIYDQLIKKNKELLCVNWIETYSEFQTTRDGIWLNTFPIQILTITTQKPTRAKQILLSIHHANLLPVKQEGAITFYQPASI